MKDRIKRFVQEHKNELATFAVGLGVGMIIMAKAERITGVEVMNYKDGGQSIFVTKANSSYSRFDRVNES